MDVNKDLIRSLNSIITNVEKKTIFMVLKNKRLISCLYLNVVDLRYIKLYNGKSEKQIGKYL